MHFIPTAIRGPLFMIVSTGSYVISDSMMKLATSGLPPYEVLVLRGLAATIWGLTVAVAYVLWRPPLAIVAPAVRRTEALGEPLRSR